VEEDTTDMNNNLWEKQIDKIIEKYEEETDENYFGYDNCGNPYTKEDAYSSYIDSEYHAQREGD
jgi:hypothetical protein